MLYLACGVAAAPDVHTHRRFDRNGAVRAHSSPFIALLSEVLLGWRSRDKTAEITYFLTSKLHVVHGCTFGTDDLLR
jgi:hypothetical protein